MTDHKIIGYFAYEPGGKVVCDGGSCVIAGSEEKMKSYIAAFGKSTEAATVKKTRFGEIKRGMELGGAYSFDEESYSRFYPLARREGINAGPEDFSERKPGTVHLVRVQRTPLSRN
jgi:hypothetical protein